MFEAVGSSSWCRFGGLISLSLGLGGLPSSPANACAIMIIESNQELFRDAVVVVEAEALDTQQNFKVELAWRGPELDTLSLTWPLERLNLCEGHQPTVPGERYLVTIQCAEPEDGNVFTCPSRAERLEDAESRIRYLRESYPLTAQEIADQLRLLASGRLSLEGLAWWVRDMIEIAEVSDWRESEDFGRWSLTLGSLGELNLALNERGVPLDEIPCEMGYFMETVLPLHIAVLEAQPASVEDVKLLEEAYFAADEACW